MNSNTPPLFIRPDQLAAAHHALNEVEMTPAQPAKDSDWSALLSGWRYRAIVLSVIAATLGYLGFAVWGGWRDVVSAVSKVGTLGVVVVLSLSLVNYGLRFLRWQIYLKALDHPLPWWPSLKIYLAGFALTTTPGKAGEAVRGVLLRPWGMPFPKSLAAFLSERLSDLLAVVLLTLFGLTAYAAAQPLIALGAAAVVAALLVLSNQRLLERLHHATQRMARLPRPLRHIFEILLQARRCHRPAVLLSATGLSVAAWAAEAVGFYLILQMMDLPTPLAFAVFVYAISSLAGALSFMPGGLGGAEGVMVALLLWQGVGKPEAIAATVLIRLATLWFAVCIGCVAIATHGRSRQA